MNKYERRYLLRQLSRRLNSWCRWKPAVFRGERHRA